MRRWSFTLLSALYGTRSAGGSRLSGTYALATLALFLVSILCILLLLTVPSLFSARYQLPPDPSTAPRAIHDLYARQSRTLAQAISRYTLLNGRDPPKHYDAWFNFAQARQCLIDADAYEQIYSDFEPFYEAEERSPGWFRSRTNWAMGINGIKVVSVTKGRVLMRGKWSMYDDAWRDMFSRFSAHLPDMVFLLNNLDEPRVLFDPNQPEAVTAALNRTDRIPFRHKPYPTSRFFQEGNTACLLSNSPSGFGRPVNDKQAFLLNSASTGFTTDLYPILSQTRITPCFSDILVPSQFYYRRSHIGPTYAYPNNILWEKKKSQIYWRGSASGGMIHGSNYHQFARFRAVDLSRAHPTLIDAALTSIPDANCQLYCDKVRIWREYDVLGMSEAREREYRSKYLLDVDGNTFSGRYLGLLRSGSLVFKSTAFTEYFNSWIRPYEHYIPVLPDLSDLVSKIEWAIEHDAEARAIADAGREVAERVVSDAQNDCYFFAVLLEYARLQGGLR